MTNTLNTSTYRCPVKIKDVKCGGEHTIVLSVMGRVYTFGHGYTGQLGLGNTKNFDRPKLVRSLANKTVVQIAAGWSHSMALTSQNNLYVTGCGKYGELGLRDNENRKTFVLLESASALNITNIFAGGHHSWLTTDNITPEKENYEIPSPLNSGNFSPTMNRSKDVSPSRVGGKTVSNTNLQQTVIPNEVKRNINLEPQSKIKSLKFDMEVLKEKINTNDLSKYYLQIIYTDLKLSHRFIRFVIHKNNKITFKELENRIAAFFNYDSSIVIYRLQDDSQILNKGGNPSTLDTILKDLKMDLNYLMMDDKEKLSYTLNIVYDVTKNKQMAALLEEINNLNKNNLAKPKERNICIFNFKLIIR